MSRLDVLFSEAEPFLNLVVRDAGFYVPLRS